MAFPHAVIARLYEHIEPIDRGERDEDPRQVRLDQQANLGAAAGDASFRAGSGDTASAYVLYVL